VQSEREDKLSMMIIMSDAYDLLPVNVHEGKLIDLVENLLHLRVFEEYELYYRGLLKLNWVRALPSNKSHSKISPQLRKSGSEVDEYLSNDEKVRDFSLTFEKVRAEHILR
jgi:hypothetical protein